MYSNTIHYLSTGHIASYQDIRGLNLDLFIFKYSKLFNFSAIFVSVPFYEYFDFVCNSFLSIQLYSKYFQSNLEVPDTYIEVT